MLSGTLPFLLTITAGIYLTFKSRFIQFRCFGESFSNIFKKEKVGKKGGISSFQAACTSLSATVGTGNIAGVAGAIAIGGAGAIFWMWISALVGMSVKLCEITLSVRYREKVSGKYTGGPMNYIKSGLGKRFMPLAVMFAGFAVVASFASGNFTQINTVTLSVSQNSGIRLLVGIIIAVLVFAVLKGGAARIALFTEKAVPVMAIIYVVLSSGVIIYNYSSVPNAMIMIFKGAFNPVSVTGGAVGTVTAAMLTGASRGIFSNEAGLGTAAMAHADSNTDNSVKEGLYGIFEVFVDTILICTLTALTVLCSGVDISYGGYASSNLVKTAFSSVYGRFSDYLMPTMLLLFGITSIVGWGYYGLQCIEFLFGRHSRKIYCVIYSAACVFGALCNTEFAWRMSALINGLMLCTNLTAVILLGGEVNRLIGIFYYNRLKKR